MATWVAQVWGWNPPARRREGYSHVRSKLSLKSHSSIVTSFFFSPPLFLIGKYRLARARAATTAPRRPRPQQPNPRHRKQTAKPHASAVDAAPEGSTPVSGSTAGVGNAPCAGRPSSNFCLTLSATTIPTAKTIRHCWGPFSRRITTDSELIVTCRFSLVPDFGQNQSAGARASVRFFVSLQLDRDFQFEWTLSSNYYKKKEIVYHNAPWKG